MNEEREIIVVGDKVLIEPEDPEEKTTSGLYLPQGVKEKEKVQTGYVVKTGPGYPTFDLSREDEPWKESYHKEQRYIPLQAQVGDYAMFLRREAIEIEYNNKKYVIVPHSAILLLLRDKYLEDIE